MKAHRNRDQRWRFPTNSKEGLTSNRCDVCKLPERWRSETAELNTASRTGRNGSGCGRGKGKDVHGDARAG